MSNYNFNYYVDNKPVMFDELYNSKINLNNTDFALANISVNPNSLTSETLEFTCDINNFDFAKNSDVNAIAHITFNKIEKTQKRHNKKKRINKKWAKKYGYNDIIKDFRIDSVDIIPTQYESCCSYDITGNYNNIVSTL